MIRPLLALTLALTLAGCEGRERCTVPEGSQPDWIALIGCEDDYALLWIERDDAIFARTRTINWLIDREDGDRVYFINTARFELHYHFARTYLDRPDATPVGTHAEFNLLNYRREGRRFVMGKLVFYVDQDLTTIELAAGDNAGADLIAWAFERVRDRMRSGDEPRYRPVSAGQEAMLPELDARIPVVRTEEVFLNQHYQPLSRGVGYGTLRFARLSELAAHPPAPTDILVLDLVPNDVPLVSGIVTGAFQTPLSHVNILARSRGTPNMALRGAFDHPELRALEGALVRLEVGPQDFEVDEAALDEAQAYWERLRPESTFAPAFDEGVTGLVELTDVGVEAVRSVGAKAANLAEMTRLGVPLPDRPLAIPFFHYRRHLDQNGITPLVESLLADAPDLSPDALDERLFDLRWRIFRAPVPAETLDLVVAEIRARFGEELRLRFRSSSNVEDLPGFSGAGLYTSAGASLAAGERTIEDAIKVVWASAWNRQAFVERDFYRVDQSRVRMGVLVHPAFRNERASGVAITVNDFSANRPAYFLNTQAGEVSVTNPTGRAIPEQLLYYTWYEEPEYEVITRSSLHPDPIFTDAELHELADYLEAIHDHFRRLHGGGAGFAMDVEYKLEPGRILVVKQARPLEQPR